MINRRIRNIILFCSILILFSIPKAVFAHAILEQATPAPNSQLPSSPKEVVLFFNERLEKELYSIHIFNDIGKSIGKSKSKLSLNQKQLRYTLPSLGKGIYTISYSVISADGHPVKGSYTISIGEPTTAKSSKALQLNPDQGQKSVYSLIRVYYFIGLLLVTGWILWGTVKNSGLVNLAEMKRSNRRIATFLQVFFFITNIGMGYVQFSPILNSWNKGELISLLTNTTIGISWTISMLLSLVGFAILLKNRWLDRAWVLLLLGAKSINGHAMAFDPRILTITMDLIHLLAASIWAGGLFYIMIYWKKQREHTREFLVVFSKFALISMIALVVTGIVSTLLFQPKLEYLLYTQWGRLLLIKIGLVGLVILIGAFLRYYMKQKNEEYIGKMLIVDFALMISITCIVGIFTYLSPNPQNKPLLWQAHKNQIEMTTNISPKIPGDNLFMVTASSNIEEINIKRIEAFLINQDNPDVAPIKIPFPEYEQAKDVHYMIEGPYLPFAGNWTVEVRVLDSEDNESVYTKDFKVY